MRRSVLLCCVQISFLLGILLSSLIFKEQILWFEGLYLLLIVAVLLWFFKLPARYWVIFLLTFLLAFSRFVLQLYSEEKQTLKNYHDLGKVTVYGCIAEDIDWRRDHSKLVLESFALAVAQGKILPAQGQLLLKTDRYHDWQYGDCLSASGELQLPGEIEDFSYQDYLRRYGIYVVMYNAGLQPLGAENSAMNLAGGDFWSRLYRSKAELEGRLNNLLHEPYSSLAAGLLTGSRRGIAENLMEDFNKTGLSHIVAVSGYNITLLIGLVFAIFSFLSRRYRVWASVTFIIVFVLFVGASAAVVRAAVMGVIALLALHFGRKSLVLLVLLLSAAWMCFFNPYILMFDAGFQLSFAATLGLVLFADKVGKYLQWLPNWFGARESLIMTLAAQVFTVPIIIWQFGRFSLIAPLANILVAPLLPLAMLFSFLAVAASYLWQFAGTALAYFAWMFLWGIVKVAQIFAALPWASMDI